MGGEDVLAGCGHCSPRTVRPIPCAAHRQACLMLACGLCGATVRHAEAAA